MAEQNKSDTDKAVDVLVGCAALMLGFVGIIVVASVIEGFVGVLLWRWFVVPFGLPPLTIAWAVGLCLTVSTFGPAPTKRTTCILKKTSTADKASEVFEALLMRPGMLLLVGYIVHRAFMP